MGSKAKAAVLDPVTPGELLWEEFLVPLGLSRYRLAGRRCRTGSSARAVDQ